MPLLNRWIDPEADLEWCDTAPPPGHVLYTLDESLPEREREPNHEADTHTELARRGIICLQIAKFGHRRRWYMVTTDEEIATVFALMLEPTGRGVDEYKRIGIAEIPEENGMAEGWDRRLVTIV